MAERVATLEGWRDRVDHDLYGNGRPGLVDQLKDFLAVQTSKKHEATRNDRRHTFLVALAAIAIPILYDIAKHSLGVK